jgi:formyl-CoA transferase
MLIVAVGNDALFEALCRVLGRAELARDPRFESAASRVEHREELDGLLEQVLASRSRDQWLQRLRQAGVPCGAVRNLGEVCSSPQLRARGMLPRVSHPTAGELGQLGSPLQLSGAPPRPPAPPPLLGQHTEEVLEGLLGYSPGELSELREEQVI